MGISEIIIIAAVFIQLIASLVILLRSDKRDKKYYKYKKKQVEKLVDLNTDIDMLTFKINSLRHNLDALINKTKGVRGMKGTGTVEESITK
jgi:hypothetical protein